MCEAKTGELGRAYRDCDFAGSRSASDDGDLVLRAEGAVRGDRCHGQCAGSIGEWVGRDLVVELRNHKEVGGLLTDLVGPEGAVAGTASYSGRDVGEGRHVVGVARAGDGVEMEDIAAEIRDHGEGAGGIDKHSVRVWLTLAVSDDGAHVVGELLVLLEYPVVGYKGVYSLAAAGETLVWTKWGRGKVTCYAAVMRPFLFFVNAMCTGPGSPADWLIFVNVPFSTIYEVIAPGVPPDSETEYMISPSNVCHVGEGKESFVEEMGANEVPSKE